MATHFWLRAESKPFERRTALPPESAKALLDAGYSLTIEADPDRIFGLDEYPDCGRAEAHSWQEAPEDAVIIGLKELPDDGSELRHRHVHFAHVFKEQRGWQDTLRRFDSGGGALFDLEFLAHENGRRVAAFGYWAGYVGAVLGAAHCDRLRNGAVLRLEPPYSFPDRGALEALVGQPPESAIVMGALGRCGSGAVDALTKLGVHGITRWDKNETAGGGPFDAILDHELFVNCVLLGLQIPPFVSREQIGAKQDRALRVVADVSCDPTSPWNPVPIYDAITTVEAPTVRAIESPPLDVMAIDHLPSLLPRESSEDFGSQLLPHLLEFDSDPNGVWARAFALFQAKQAAAT
ncbi:MAG: saccharopine dehydrogenase [bacterium]|nr:saccharopine dehydrogenase [bacterium]